ncbi:MAG TPA: hypothetical protein VLG28_15625 [Acidimicrobiia bacterium]|jgi:hypothetical protein|nr:hypothetical protein [Acidimicrobiia bacterium]
MARAEAAAELLLSPSVVPTAEVLALVPGRVVGLEGPPGLGLTRLGLSMLATVAGRGPVAYVDVRGWLCPPAAWELGIDPGRLIVVRCDDPVTWGRVVTGLLEGMQAVYAEVPARMKDAQLRKLAAMTRSRRTPLVLRPVQGSLPSGVAHLRLAGKEIEWEGAGAGFGRLAARRLVMEATGKVMRGMARTIEVEDDGTHAVRVVSGLGAAPAGRTAG